MCKIYASQVISVLCFSQVFTAKNCRFPTMGLTFKSIFPFISLSCLLVSFLCQFSLFISFAIKIHFRFDIKNPNSTNEVNKKIKILSTVVITFEILYHMSGFPIVLYAILSPNKFNWGDPDFKLKLIITLSGLFYVGYLMLFYIFLITR